jgi:hypothetical protein
MKSHTSRNYAQIPAITVPSAAEFEVAAACKK